MSLENRFAQFAPFSALAGYEDEVLETERLTDERLEQEEQKNIYNRIILLLDNSKINIDDILDIEISRN